MDAELKSLLLIFNPKAGVSYRISAVHRVYASYARASKEPTRADFTDSPVAPRPEYLDDFELGYGFTSSRFDASANVYYMNYLDQLVPTGELNDGSYAIQMNVDKSYRLGIELQAEYRPVKWFTWSLNARAHEEFRIKAEDHCRFVFAVKPE